MFLCEGKDATTVKYINIPNFSFEITPTESTAGVTLLYIGDHLAYQNQKDLNWYKINNLESTFIEITNPNKSNTIAGCWISTLPNPYLNPLLEKLAKEQKTAFLPGNVNVNLWKYQQQKSSNYFLISCHLMFFSSLLPTQFLFYNWDSFHARLNSNYKGLTRTRTNNKKIKTYRKSR